MTETSSRRLLAVYKVICVIVVLAVIPVAIWDQRVNAEPPKTGDIAYIKDTTLAFQPSRQEIDRNGWPRYVEQERCSLEEGTKLHVHAYRGGIAIAEVMSPAPKGNEEACHRADVVRVDTSNLKKGR